MPVVPEHQQAILNDLSFLASLSGHPRVLHPYGCVTRTPDAKLPGPLTLTSCAVLPLLPNLGVLLRDFKLHFSHAVILRIATQVR